MGDRRLLGAVVRRRRRGAEGCTTCRSHAAASIASSSGRRRRRSGATRRSPSRRGGRAGRRAAAACRTSEMSACAARASSARGSSRQPLLLVLPPLLLLLPLHHLQLLLLPPRRRLELLRLLQPEPHQLELALLGVEGPALGEQRARAPSAVASATFCFIVVGHQLAALGRPRRRGPGRAVARRAVGARGARWRSAQLRPIGRLRLEVGAPRDRRRQRCTPTA